MLTLTNVRGTDGTIKNGQSAETGNIRHTRHVTKKTTILHRKLNRWAKLTTTKTRGDISSINNDLNHHLNIKYI
jgi:hypothetical protein